MLDTNCTYVTDGSGALVSSTCSGSLSAFESYSGSLNFKTIARITQDGQIQLNTDVAPVQDFFVHGFLFPLYGLLFFIFLVRWFIFTR